MAAPTPQPRAAPQNVPMAWIGKQPAWLLALATVLALLPFAGKPFNIDDPLFIWTAQHIHAHPLDPYGFNVNWYGYDLSMSATTQNPPLACYYLALVGGIFGWSEFTLHTAFLLPGIAAVVGTYRLAMHLCKRALLAAFLALFTPVFLLSSTTLMCDVMMLAFWVWALIFWMEGTQRERAAPLALAAILIALASLTKYFGACLIPLVAAWSIRRKQPVREWLGWLAIPVLALAAYQLITKALYGHGLLTGAGAYATAIHKSSILLNLNFVLVALTFTGGCLATATFFAPMLWTGRSLLIGAVSSLAVAAILFLAIRSTLPAHAGALEITQILVWAAGGISLIALAIADFHRQRDADSLLLGCWMLGTFAFTAFFNWTVNGRSILPMAIPAAILVARRLEQRESAGVKYPWRLLLMPALAGGVLAIWVTTADYFFASAPPIAARAIQSAYGDKNHRIWFQGHWGFQYYMQQNGATPLDLQKLGLTEGDYVAMPSGNSNVYPLKEPMVELETFSIPPFGSLTTMNEDAGAGFYASLWGALPFAFGPNTGQSVTVFAYDPAGELLKATREKKP